MRPNGRKDSRVVRVQGGNLEGEGSVLCLKTRWLEYPERGGIPIWTELPS